MIEFNNETVNVTDGDDHIALSVTTAGTKGDPAVILLHGFPETSLSWRHQLPALAEAGHFVIAADGRGFGNSDCPEAVEAYRIDQLTGDVVALAAHYGYDELVVVGHDWGSLIAGSLAAFRPDLVRALVLMSVPYQIRTSVSIPEHIIDTDPEGPYAYMLAMQEPGVIDSLMDADPRGTLAGAHAATSAEGATYMSDAALDAYAGSFAKTGFGPGINYYRNMQANFDITRPWRGARLTMPVGFIAGSADFVVGDGDGGMGSTVASMAETCLDYRGATLIDDAGHFVQQEAPEETNAVLLSFLASLATSTAGGAK